MIAALLAELEQRTGRRVLDGLQIVGLQGLVSQPFDPGWPLLIVAAPEGAAGVADGDPAPLPGRTVHGGHPLALLQALYPADHPVLGLAGAPDTTIGALTSEALGGSARTIGSPTTGAPTPDAFDAAHYLPAVAPLDDLASPHMLPWLAARLRAPDGCPWDRAQTHESLRKHLLEEAYEVYDALEAGATPSLADELGDLLLQVVLHAQHAAEAGVFDLLDVYRAIDAKIVRRHPHVFGSASADSVEQVMRTWEQIKAAERAARGGTGAAPGGPGAAPGAASAVASEAGPKAAMPAAFAGLSRSLPALAYSQEMQDRAAGLGYDWPDLEGVIDKVEEEAVELLEAASPEARREEFGDLLMVLVNLGRKLGLDAEAALRAASGKFAARFATVERLAAAEGQELRELDMEQLDRLWQQAKQEERA
ncbi:MAG TPA: nucleoside triphosphate pyrophosphohydrolase [Candidatus Limnocylindrales bacterium]|nr:nucleoside triphosphate pyrophosphohydrolase [Candidatus Limnocylindrales bacterium]